MNDRTILIAGATGIVGSVKLWNAGFNGCEDTEDALLYWLARMQQLKLLPA